MNIDVYEQLGERLSFLSVPAGTDISTITELQGTNYKIFKSNLVVEPGQGRIAMDIQEVLSDIQNKGFAKHKAEIRSVEPD